MAAKFEYAEMLEAESQTRQSAERESSGVTVWLVDDDDNFRELLAELLQLQGGVVCNAQFTSAESAIEALRHEPAPDVILLDVQMRGLSGLDAIRPMKQLAATTQILMLTAFYDSQRRARALREGATDFLVKIDTVEKLSRQIRQARIPFGEEDLERRSEREDAVGSERAGLIAGESSIWPTRCASTPSTGARNHSEVTQEHPESGHRSMLWHRAPEWLVRGVAFLGSAAGIGQ